MPKGIPNAPYRNMIYDKPRDCCVCGKEFRATRFTARYCGPTCRKRAQRKDPTWVEPRDRERAKRRKEMGLE